MKTLMWGGELYIQHSSGKTGRKENTYDTWCIEKDNIRINVR
jgi:hypothetical protein